MYETEEQQLEALKKWWQANGTSAIVGLVVGIAVILGFNYWQDYKKSQAEQASLLYAQLTQAAQANKKESVEELAKRIETQFASTDYVAYSQFMLAKIKVEADDLTGARQALEKVANLPNTELSNIAKIRLVRLMMANHEYEQGLKLISDVDPAKTAQFEGNYDELVGDLYVALGRFDQARSSYQKAQENGYRSPILQLKIDDLTAPDKVMAPQ